jgi:hypothetical protein
VPAVLREHLEPVDMAFIQLKLTAVKVSSVNEKVIYNPPIP